MNSTKSILESMGFKVDLWQLLSDHSKDLLQITDSNGITFYMPESATVAQCMDRYAQKLSDFNNQTTTK